MASSKKWGVTVYGGSQNYQPSWGDFVKIMKEKLEILQPILTIRGKVGLKIIKIELLKTLKKFLITLVLCLIKNRKIFIPRKKVPSKTATNKNKKKTKSATAISLKKLRKSKEFRDLGDTFDYFSD